jgi:hypothetical protein
VAVGRLDGAIEIHLRGDLFPERAENGDLVVLVGRHEVLDRAHPRDLRQGLQGRGTFARRLARLAQNLRGIDLARILGQDALELDDRARTRILEVDRVTIEADMGQREHGEPGQNQHRSGAGRPRQPQPTRGAWRQQRPGGHQPRRPGLRPPEQAQDRRDEGERGQKRDDDAARGNDAELRHADEVGRSEGEKRQDRGEQNRRQ